MKCSEHIRKSLRQDIKQLKQKLAQVGSNTPAAKDLQQPIARLEKKLEAFEPEQDQGMPSSNGWYVKRDTYSQMIIKTTDVHLGLTLRNAMFSPCDCRQCWKCYVLDVYLSLLASDYALDVTLFQEGTWSQWDQARFVLEYGQLDVGKVNRELFYTHLRY